MIKNSKALKCVLLIIILAVSLLISGKAASIEAHKDQIEYLQEKEDSGKALIAASAATSVVMTLIPGDAGTPLAEKLADICGYFTIALCAILLEKYLLTLSATIAFKYLIPIACLIFGAGIFLGKERIKKTALRFGLIALVIYMIVPFSIKASKIIEQTYGIISVEASVSEDLDKIYPDESDDIIDGITKDPNAEENIFQKIADSVKSFGQKVSTTVTELPETLSKDVNTYLEEGEKKLSLLIEGLAIMIVTSCLIPIFVLLILIYIVKTLSGLEFDTKQDMLPVKAVSSLLKDINKDASSGDSSN